MSAALSDQELFTRKEAADYLSKRWRQRVSAQTLAAYAMGKKGPRYEIVNTKSGAIYSKTDLDTWAAGRLLPGRVP